MKDPVRKRTSISKSADPQQLHSSAESSTAKSWWCTGPRTILPSRKAHIHTTGTSRAGSDCGRFVSKAGSPRTLRRRVLTCVSGLSYAGLRQPIACSVASSVNSNSKLEGIFLISNLLLVVSFNDFSKAFFHSTIFVANFQEIWWSRFWYFP